MADTPYLLTNKVLPFRHMCWIKHRSLTESLPFRCAQTRNKLVVVRSDAVVVVHFISRSLMKPLNGKRRLSILCAEDDDAIGQVLVQYLTAAGHVADHAADGFAAWKIICADIGRYDVLITDNDMPGLTGLELVEMLHAVKYPGRMIVHSGAVNARDRARYQAFGVQNIIMKSTPPGEILQAVEGSPLR